MARTGPVTGRRRRLEGALQRLGERRPEDAPLGDDAGDVAVRRDVERGVADVRAHGRQPCGAEMADLALVALLDRNVIAVRRRQIDGRERRRDVERHLVLVREHGHGIGADLVGGIAVGGDAVGADDDDVDVAGAHQRSGHALGDDRGVDALAHQLPRGQARALQERTRLVGDDRDPLALLDGRADHAERRAVAGRGQRAGVAVREHAGAVGHHRRAVPAHRPAVGDVLVVNRPRFPLEPVGDLVGRLRPPAPPPRTRLSSDRSPRTD